MLESKTSSAFSRELSQSPTQKSTFSIEDKHEDPVLHVLEGGGVLFVRQAGTRFGMFLILESLNYNKLPILWFFVQLVNFN